MPLFRRTDADLIEAESSMRRMMPFLMRRRNESLVFHAGQHSVGPVVRCLAGQRRPGDTRPPTLFEYFLWTVARVLHAHPRLNRFVSAGRMYQRRGVFLSFAALTARDEPASLVTVKVGCPEGEGFGTYASRVAEAIQSARAGRSPVDRELALAARLPAMLLRPSMATVRWADRLNLLPGSMIANDPLYTSAFLANLGSLGLSDTFHHLYEYGTASVFGVLGELHAGNGTDRTVTVNWTFDERVTDGRDCAAALARFRGWFEAPPGI